MIQFDHSMINTHLPSPYPKWTNGYIHLINYQTYTIQVNSAMPGDYIACFENEIMVSEPRLYDINNNLGILKCKYTPNMHMRLWNNNTEYLLNTNITLQQLGTIVDPLIMKQSNLHKCFTYDICVHSSFSLLCTLCGFYSKILKSILWY